jgi:hypothetical protein
MTQMTRVALMLGVVMLTGAGRSAVAQEKHKPGTAGKEQVWEVDFLIGDDHYTGTMSLKTIKGAVTGKMLIDSPSTIEGQVEGTQTGDTLALDYAYTMVAEKCTGRVRVQATLADKGQEASGAAHVVDCHGQAIDGTVTMKKPAVR